MYSLCIGGEEEYTNIPYSPLHVPWPAVTNAAPFMLNSGGRLWTESIQSFLQQVGLCWNVLTWVSRGKMMKLEKPKDARKWVEWSFFHRFLSPVLFILLPAPLLHIPMAISSLFEVVLGFACCSSHHRWLIVLPLNLSLVFSRSLSLFPSLENAGRVPRQKELSSPCQQPRVWDRPVSWQQ